MLVSSSSISYSGSSLRLIPNTDTIRPPLSQPCVRFRRPNFIAAYATISRADMASPVVSLYEILGIPMSATGNQIKTAYRKLARTCHPDVASASQRDSSTIEFMKIHAAYSTLLDPTKRAVYDRDLFSVRHRFSSTVTAAADSSTAMATVVSGFSGYPRRNWETDQCW